MDLYMKNQAGEFVPVAIECVVDPKEWSGKLVMVKLGDATKPATEKDEEEFARTLELAEAVYMKAKDASIMIGLHSVTFEVREKGDE